MKNPAPTPLARSGKVKPKRDGQSAPELSVIVPHYNEEASVPEFVRRVVPALESTGIDWEVICVDDGSTDETYAALRKARRGEPRIKVVGLTRNFGKEVALCAGMDFSRGAAVVLIDADLEEPPELIRELVAKWREGFDIVYAARESRRHDSWIRRQASYWFYKAFNRLTGLNISGGGDFHLLDRKVVEFLTGARERRRFMKGLFSWGGFRQTSITFERKARVAGKSKWSYWRLWNLALDFITGFSTMPLRIWTYVGAATSFAAFCYGVFVIAWTLAKERQVPGYASILVSILFLGGIQLISLGVIGEYMARIYEEVRPRPLYLVKDRAGFVDKPKNGQVAVSASPVAAPAIQSEPSGDAALQDESSKKESTESTVSHEA